MSTNQQNPVGVIDAKSGRLFSRTDHENLQRIERDAIIDEVVRFERLLPQFAEIAQQESMEAWTVTDGITSKTNFTASNVAQRLITTTENLLATGSYSGLDFYDRLTRSVMKRAKRQAFLEKNGLTWEPDLADGDADPRHPAVVFEWDDKRAKRLARWLARHALPVAFEKTLVVLENSAKAHRAFLEERRRLAREFAQEHTKDIAPSALEIDDLARRLFELIFSPTDPPMDEILTAAKKNPLLASALRNYDEWRDKLRDLTRLHGPGEETQKQASLQNAVTFARIWAFHWPTVFHDWQLDHVVRLGTARAIERLKAPSSAESRLRAALAAEIERQDFKQAMPWPKYKHSEDFEPRLIWPAHEETETDGMATALAQLVRYLRGRFCPKNEGPALERIEGIEARGRKDLDEWKSQQGLEGVPQGQSPWLRLTPVVVASYVAQVLWCDREQADFERTTASSPALVAQVHADVGLLFRPSDTQREFDLRSPGLAWLDIGTEEDAARLFGAGATLTFQRLIRYLPTVVHEMWARTQRDEADVVIEGGFAALAELVGAKSKKAAAEVRDGLMLGSSIRREWADGSEAQGLWVFHSTPAAPGRAARLIITLSAAFRPKFVHQLPKGPGRTLVPVVPLPAFTGANRLWAAQAALQWEVTRRFSEGRQEAAREGGVSITTGDWKRMLERVGLPAHLLPEVLETWQKGEAPFLENVRGDLWTMANSAPFASARAWLQDQAALAGHGRKRGLVSAAKKRGRRKASK